MGSRQKRKPRCTGCGLPPERCVCDRLPLLRFSTPVAFVQHVDEIHKPTNTARVFRKMVEGTAILPYGMREPAFDPSPLDDPAIDWRLLFPRDDAAQINEVQINEVQINEVQIGDAVLQAAPGRRLGFVVLDGTWHQCSRMSRRVPRVHELPCVSLPAGEPSFWTVRTQHDPRGMSSFDAAYRALRAVEGAAACRPLLEAFALVTANMLFLKGRLASPQVPPEWLA